MSKLIVPILTATLVVSAMCYQAMTPSPTLCAAPDVHLLAIAGMQDAPLAISEAEKETLPKDTRIEKRVYTEPNGASHCVSIVIGGAHKASIHRPELCLPAQGYLMLNPRKLKLGEVNWRRITLASRHGGENQGFAYTFFNQAGYHTESHVKRIFRDVWDRSFYNRIDRWVMITVYSSNDDDRATADFLTKLKEAIK